MVFRGVIVFLPIVETDFAAVKRERNKVIMSFFLLCSGIQIELFDAEQATSIFLKI